MSALIASLRHWPLHITLDLWLALTFLLFFAGFGGVLFLLLAAALVFAAGGVIVGGLAVVMMACAFVAVRCYEDALHELAKVRL